MIRLGALSVTFLAALVFMSFQSELLAPPLTQKLFELSKPSYIARKGKPWAERSRLLGDLKFAPDTFKLTLKSAGTGKLYKEFSFPGALTVYVTPMITVGSYDLTVSSEGFKPIEIKSLNLKPGADCRINIAFDRED